MLIERKDLPHNYAEIISNEFGITRSYASMIRLGRIPQPRRANTIKRVKAIQNRLKELSDLYLFQVEKADIYIAEKKEVESLVLENSNSIDVILAT